MQDHTKHRIDVSASPKYLPDQSQPDRDRYVFAYTITIFNAGTVAARLLTRHWIITDANDKVQEVRGEGVVGQQPYLAPGMSFEYTSGAIIETPVGTTATGGFEPDMGTFFFAGLISDESFGTATIGSTLSAPSGWNADNLVFAPIPAPAALALPE